MAEETTKPARTFFTAEKFRAMGVFMGLVILSFGLLSLNGLQLIRQARLWLSHTTSPELAFGLLVILGACAFWLAIAFILHLEEVSAKISFFTIKIPPEITANFNRIIQWGFQIQWFWAFGLGVASGLGLLGLQTGCQSPQIAFQHLNESAFEFTSREITVNPNSSIFIKAVSIEETEEINCRWTTRSSNITIQAPENCLTTVNVLGQVDQELLTVEAWYPYCKNIRTDLLILKEEE